MSYSVAPACPLQSTIFFSAMTFTLPNVSLSLVYRYLAEVPSLSEEEEYVTANSGISKDWGKS